VTLSEGNIPAHKHDTQLGFAEGKNTIWGYGPPKLAVSGAQAGTWHTMLTSPYGQETPAALATTPPYVALYYCKKD
jgi:hypothetical protein